MKERGSPVWYQNPSPNFVFDLLNWVSMKCFGGGPESHRWLQSWWIAWWSWSISSILDKKTESVECCCLDYKDDFVYQLYYIVIFLIFYIIEMTYFLNFSIWATYDVYLLNKPTIQDITSFWVIIHLFSQFLQKLSKYYTCTQEILTRKIQSKSYKTL